MSTDLRARVRHELRTTNEANPGVIAETILADLADEDVRPALEQVLRLFVRQVISEIRISRPPTPATPLRGSSKVAAIRNWHARLHDRYHVGDGEWKLLADMTFDDLNAAAVERRELAARNAAWADQLEAWAQLVRRHGVATFGELPADEQEQALGSAA